jgi:hypothetical protein
MGEGNTEKGKLSVLFGFLAINPNDPNYRLLNMYPIMTG